MSFPDVPPWLFAPPLLSIFICSRPRIAFLLVDDLSSWAGPKPCWVLWWFLSRLRTFCFGVPLPLVRPVYTLQLRSSDELIA